MKIVFQGDSITDWHRNREDFYDLGEGYPVYCADILRSKMPDTEFTFINRGISGDHIHEVAARIKTECIDYAPDLVSLLVGINDVGSEAGGISGYSAKQFEKDYRDTVNRLKTECGCRLILMEPFMLRNDPYFAVRYPLLAERIDIVRQIAKEYADRYIALDGLFAQMCVLKPEEYWSPDGVHPSAAGAEVIAGVLSDAVISLAEEMR